MGDVAGLLEAEELVEDERLLLLVAHVPPLQRLAYRVLQREQTVESEKYRAIEGERGREGREREGEGERKSGSDHLKDVYKRLTIWHEVKL